MRLDTAKVGGIGRDSLARVTLQTCEAWTQAWSPRQWTRSSAALAQAQAQVRTRRWAVQLQQKGRAKAMPTLIVTVLQARTVTASALPATLRSLSLRAQALASLQCTRQPVDDPSLRVLQVARGYARRPRIEHNALGA